MSMRQGQDRNANPTAFSGKALYSNWKTDLANLTQKGDPLGRDYDVNCLQDSAL